MMKKFLLLPLLVLLLGLYSCFNRTDGDYIIISNQKVDGYDIYQLEHHGLFCNQNYQDIYYSGKTYNYGFSFKACSHDMSFFILSGAEYIYLGDAIDIGLISIESLLPELEAFERDPEVILEDEAEYYWSDFHINGDVVYIYAGGECDQYKEEIFVIDGNTYFYGATGCLKSHILFMQVNGSYVSVQSLISEGEIDPTYLIPLLEEKQ